MVSVLASNGRSLVEAPIGSNQRLSNWYLIFIASPLSTQYKRERIKTVWLGIRIMCPNGHVYAQTFASVSWHYENPTKRVHLEQSGSHDLLIEN